MGQPDASTRPEDGILAIRKKLGLYANLRPVKVYQALINSSPIKPSLLEGVDMVVLRELTGGLYFARPKRRWTTKTGRRGVDTLRYTEHEIERIVRMAFELARGRRGHLTSVDKANVLESSRLWRQVTDEVHEDYPDVELEHILVDAAAMALIRKPASIRRDSCREHVRRHPDRRGIGAFRVYGDAAVGVACRDARRRRRRG